MQVPSILRYITSCLALLCLPVIAFSQEDEDSTADKKIVVTQNRFSVGVDFFQPILNSFTGAKKSYEIAFDYSLPKDIYLALEAGFGNAKVDYTAPTLQYTSSNSFFRVGFQKSMLQRMSASDWDMVFIGLRYGMGFIKRSDAIYSIDNQYFGNSSGVIPGTNLTAHWIEITGGMRVDLVAGLFAGYNIRAKFLINPKSFKELAPYNIAGFGKGEKTAVFDFNMYLGYAINWNKKNVAPSTPTEPQP